ncbi:hypothetical protein KDX09_36640 [Burkholderia cenocepacia]|uniref:hypothetical protein n=1 Tax=Burkholderia cenocepacia TaxID=95486 RepID=UPI001B95763B|nr:hypothetical protein [Burkholderia cenocepacia]MBR8094891.1 hypothetical protein [Burkholderia cenocepacia]
MSHALPNQLLHGMLRPQRKRHLHLVWHLIAQQYANLDFLLLAQNALLANLRGQIHGHGTGAGTNV